MKILNKTTGIVLIVVGLLIVAADLLATPLGILGSGFGPKHIIALVVGLVVVVVGLIPVLSKGGNPKNS